jgi:hypothetical protein
MAADPLSLLIRPIGICASGIGTNKRGAGSDVFG